MSQRYIGGLIHNAPGGWSGKFNGSGQYLNCGDQTAYEFGSGAFTIEAWVYLTSFASTCTIASKYVGGNVGASEFVFWVTTSGVLAIALDGGGGEDYIQSASGAIALNNWYHVAVCKSGSTVYLFANGNLLTSGTSSRTLNSTSTSLTLGGITTGSSLTGYISNLRILKGTALYTAAFTPPSGALQPITNTSLLTCAYPTFRDGSTNAFTLTAVGATVDTSNPFPTSVLPNPALGNAGNGIYTMSQYAALLAANQWPAIDPYYENVTLNLHGNAGTVLPFNTDASTNNFQVTQVGDTRPSNYTPFIANGYWSNYFDGSGDYLSIADANALDFAGDFTVEAWVFVPTTSGSARTIIHKADTNVGYALVLISAGNIEVQCTSLQFNSTSILPLNQWNHVAMVRNGSGTNNVKFYLNGVLDGQGTNTTDTASSVTLGIGAVARSGAAGVNPLNGYISNVRTVASAVYTSAFTPSTIPLTAITNTSLLTCQSNRFVDNSTNNFTVTRNGDTAVNPYQPFTAPTGTSAYGSGFFDGTGD